jgi:pimeloyl-ACP methyl ester carboxylesterase
MIKKIYLSFILCLIIAIGTSLTGCITEEEPKEQKKEQNIEEIAIQTVEHLRKSEFNQAYELFDETVTDQMSTQQLEEIWDLLLIQYGEFDKIISTRIDIEAGYDVVYVTCNFSILGLLDIKMVFDNEQRIAGFQFVPSDIENKYEPPEYSDLELFDEVNITVGTGIWELPGTLTIPKGGGPFPVIVLVHGSGPNDRDESIGPNKPFKDLAWGLASRGTAVFRYEKRTKEYPEQSAALTNLTVQEEVIDDVIAAIDLLNITERIDQEQMFILGHSLGGMLGPRIIEQDNRIAGLIILAGPTRHLEDLFLEQTIYLANLDGEINEKEAIQIANIQEQVNKIRELDISEGEFILGVSKAYWQDLADYHPVETAENLSKPMLILQGERDYQVTIDGDFINWNKSLYTYDNVTLKTYESLNHLFISGNGPSSNAEYLIEGHIEQEVIDDISEWIKNH